MCGIAGIVYYSSQRNVIPEHLKAVTNIIDYRGPDDEGYFIKENVGLGFRRLSIIDLNTGHQPLSNEESGSTIVFNGEIYNYLELRDHLRKKGYSFKTETDTEVILHLYEEYGADCLQYLRGMFGFAIWDDRKKELFCARDRFGIKPFYFYHDKEKFVFGSEIKTILQCPDVDKTISADALDSYFTFGYITSDLSIYDKIHKLQPGHFLKISPNDATTPVSKSYWEIQFEPDYSKTESQWAEELESCLMETTRLHMISDVPLGAFLSGGIDSSSVVAMMARNSNQPIKTFSIGFREQKFNELQYAREVAQRYGCDHHEQIVEPESIGLIPKLVSAYSEPFSDSSAIPTYYVSKLAREFVTVALSGDGGDELFAGYKIYNYLQGINRHPLNFKSGKLNAAIWGKIHELMPQGVKGKGYTYFLSKEKEMVAAYIHIWSEVEREKLLLKNQSSVRKERGSELYKESILRKGSNNDFITNLQYLDLKTYMVDDILTKVDRASMLNSLEVRVPLLDHKFAELSFKIPSNLKLKGSAQKYIFKKSMEPHLPPGILQHAKQGFTVPFSMWFKDDLKKYVDDVLLAQNSLLSNYLDTRYVKKIIETNRTGMRDFSHRIWNLLIFEEWLKQNQGR